jgi:hypothetical protein
MWGHAAEDVMPVKGLLKLSFFVAAMVVSANSHAQDRKPGMLGGSFDLKSAILSPTPLGPPSQFEPAAAASRPAAPVAETRAEAKPEAKAKASHKPTPRKVVSSKPRQKPAVAARKPRSNPLNSYATDTRRQTWPCKGGSGGICAWTQQR